MTRRGLNFNPNLTHVYDHARRPALACTGRRERARLPASPGASEPAAGAAAPACGAARPVPTRAVHECLGRMRGVCAGRRAVGAWAAHESAAARDAAAQVMPLLRHILENATDRPHALLRAKALECISLVGMSVGRARFRDDAARVMQLMQALQVPPRARGRPALSGAALARFFLRPLQPPLQGPCRVGLCSRAGRARCAAAGGLSGCMPHARCARLEAGSDRARRRSNWECDLGHDSAGSRAGGGGGRAPSVPARAQAQELDPDDPTSGYMLQAGARLCKCLGEEFLPYLGLVMPPLLAAAQLKPDVHITDAASDADEADDDDEARPARAGGQRV